MSQILRHTREAKGITLEDVAQRTYIKLPYLVALEEGHIEDLLAPVFVHGYIRQYARLLGLNAAELVQQYQHEVKRETPRLVLAQPVLATADGEAVPGKANGHPGPRPFTPGEEEVLQPLTAADVSPPPPSYFAERTVPMERPVPPSHPTPVDGRADAQVEAQRIVAEAQREADRLRREAAKYAYQVLSELESELSRTLAIVRNGRQFLQQRRRHAAAEKN